MTHPIIALQKSLVATLAADADLAALIGANAVFDAPPKGKVPPYVAIIRHDVLPRDADNAPGWDHRLVLHLWHPDPSRKAVLAIAGIIAGLLQPAALASSDLLVTNINLQRTDTAIDVKTGQARAVLSLRIFSEPQV